MASSSWITWRPGGIEIIFGYPGDGINGVLRGLEKAGDKFTLIAIFRTKETIMAQGRETIAFCILLGLTGVLGLHLLAKKYNF